MAHLKGGNMMEAVCCTSEPELALSSVQGVEPYFLVPGQGTGS